MTSIVGRLARTLSQGGSGGAGASGLPDGDRHRRGFSAAEGERPAAAFPGGGVLSPRVLGKMTPSGSFNDFSLLVQEDAAAEYGSYFSGTNTSGASGQLEGSILGLDKTKYDAHGQNELQRRGPFATAPIPKKELSLTGMSGANVPRPGAARTGSVKVMGLDAYDYHDLLQSTSH